MLRETNRHPRHRHAERSGLEERPVAREEAMICQEKRDEHSRNLVLIPFVSKGEIPCTALISAYPNTYDIGFIRRVVLRIWIVTQAPHFGDIQTFEFRRCRYTQ